MNRSTLSIVCLLLRWCAILALCLAPSAHADSSFLAPPDAAFSEYQAPPSFAEEPEEPPRAYLLPLPSDVSPWDEPEPGFEVARFPAISAQGRDMDIMVVRIDPARFDFVIRTATAQGEKPRTLKDWADAHNLAAVINAGMYLPDGLTNTGYLRVGAHENNPRLVQRFGAFLFAEPLDPQLPSVQLLDRTDSEWESLLPRYKSVVQNYRMVSATRKLLWRDSPQVHAISAIGQDSKGRILFIHSREPVSGVDFASMALDLPMDLHTLMYVEGGTQAGMYIRPGGAQLRLGRHPADFWTDGSVNQLLPNIIGVKARGR